MHTFPFLKSRTIKHSRRLSPATHLKLDVCITLCCAAFHFPVVSGTTATTTTDAIATTIVEAVARDRATTDRGRDPEGDTKCGRRLNSYSSTVPACSRAWRVCNRGDECLSVRVILGFNKGICSFGGFEACEGYVCCLCLRHLLTAVEAKLPVNE